MTFFAFKMFKASGKQTKNYFRVCEMQHDVRDHSIKLCILHRCIMDIIGFTEIVIKHSRLTEITNVVHLNRIEA